MPTAPETAPMNVNMASSDGATVLGPTPDETMARTSRMPLKEAMIREGDARRMSKIVASAPAIIAVDAYTVVSASAVTTPSANVAISGDQM